MKVKKSTTSSFYFFSQQNRNSVDLTGIYEEQQ
uniref:Uncharacterized protein n=1 Tax=Arundo donax TaxID=35708 RepID=A0A0A9GPF4_ARUDO